MPPRVTDVLGAVAGVLVLADALPASPAGMGEAPATPEAPSAYARLLATHVEGDRVDYPAWHASPDDRAALAAVIDTLESIDPTILSPDARVAYWINLYNAVTLDAVLEGYPVPSIRALTPPDTPTIWKRARVLVAGDSLSLDGIEHERLRARFEEPRIHFALNCASKGCPPLLVEPFTGDRLDAQLDLVTRRSLRDPRWVRVEEDGRRLALSPLFDWFADDFTAGAGSVAGFVAAYRDDLSEVRVRRDPPEVRWLEYDWSLNAVDR